MTLDNSCLLVESPRFPKNYPNRAFDRTSEITFPSPTKCTSVKMTFLEEFNLQTGNDDCSGNDIDKLLLTKIKPDGTTNGQIGKFCDTRKPDAITENVDLTEFAKLRVRFKNSASTGSAAGFRLQVCLEDCN